MQVLVRYHEIGLKGKNRPFFVNRLVTNLKRALWEVPGTGVRPEQGQIVVTVPDNTPVEEIHRALASTFGIARYAFANEIGRDVDSIKAGVKIFLEANERPFSSFRIASTRADKRFPLTSPELNAEIGSFVKELTGAKVDLRKAELTVHVDVRHRATYLYLEPNPGPGGLPVGSSGRVAALLSGGIDSPVAAMRMMRRGCPVTFVHFHSFPLVDASSREKAVRLVEILDRYQHGSRLFLVPFADVQREIIAAVPASYRVVIYRRFMVRIAEAIAQNEGAFGLVTGESVGQVASQTMENIATVDAPAEMPILRPLIGMDKIEIIDQARAIKTYDVSIEPDEDCCSLFVPAHPVLRSTLIAANRAEDALDVQRLVTYAIERSEIINIRAPAQIA
jgi:thiamine biosynthesis protein ThiI